MGTKTAGDLVILVRHDADLIKDLAYRSKNLKSTFTRALKEAAENILWSAEELGSTTSSEENIRLREENAKLRAETENLQKTVLNIKGQMEEIRKEIRRGTVVPAVTGGKWRWRLYVPLSPPSRWEVRRPRRLLPRGLVPQRSRSWCRL